MGVSARAVPTQHAGRTSVEHSVPTIDAVDRVLRGWAAGQSAREYAAGVGVRHEDPESVLTLPTESCWCQGRMLGRDGRAVLRGGRSVVVGPGVA